MKIDAAYQIEQIAGDTDRAILQHILITRWQDKPVAVAADGFTCAVVPVELEDGDVEGIVHFSVFEHMRWLVEGRGKGERLHYGPFVEEMSVQLGAETVTFEDGWTAPRKGNTAGMDFPDWRKVMPERHMAEPVVASFGIQPRLLALTADALGATMVTVHHPSSPTQIIVSPTRQAGAVLEPPFAVMMLTMIERPPTVGVVEDELAGARS